MYILIVFTIVHTLDDESRAIAVALLTKLAEEFGTATFLLLLNR